MMAAWPNRRSVRTRRNLLGAVLTAALWSLLVGSALADPGWKIATSADTVGVPASTLTYYIQVGNTGTSATDGVTPYTLTVTLPTGLLSASAGGGGWDCPGAPGASVIVCTSTDEIDPHHTSTLAVTVDIDPSATGTLATAFDISGGGALASVSTVDPTRIGTVPAAFGIDAFDGAITADPSGTPYTQAGGHPYEITTTIDFNQRTDPNIIVGPLVPVEPVKDIFVDLPPGFVGDPTAPGARCTVGQLAVSAGTDSKPLCPAASQVGTATALFNHGLGAVSPLLDALPVPVYNLTQPADVPARFGFNFMGTVVTLDATVRSGDDYGLSVNASKLPEGVAFVSTRVTFWGVPADPSHDTERACPGEVPPWTLAGPGTFCTSDAPLKPFLRNPTSCTPAGVGLLFALRTDSWLHPDVFKSASFVTHDVPGYPLLPTQWGGVLGTTGCDRVPFDADLDGTPASLDTNQPSGYTFDLTVPQTSDPGIIGTGDVRKVVATLPKGVALSPSSANGLEACSPAQIGLHSEGPANCPDASKVGQFEVHTPLLEDPLKGSIYLATPHDNPFTSLVAIYLVANGPGVVIKLAGNVHLDPVTGQVTTTFDNNPQLPFDHLHLEFFDGPQAALANPSKADTYTTHSTITSWSGASVSSDSSFTVSGKPRGFTPGFNAGTVNPVSGAFSPFGLRLQRSDTDGEFRSLPSLSLPPGLSASLRGTTYCPNSALDAADTSKNSAHTGIQELAAPSCPASSRIGTATVGAGAGPSPFYVDTGKVYLAGPYRGAPLSIAVSVPAVAGPFDLGNVIVRSALYVDPSDASLKAVSDPFPTILDGIPLQIKDIRLNVDRPHFTLNPTNCSQMAVNGTVLSTENMSADVHSRFQVGECAALGFKPKLSFRLKGGTKRGDHPKFQATLKARPGEANIARAQVTLPHSEFLDNAHIRTVCTRVQFAANQCPAASIYGHARAITPLLDQPLEGPVFLRSSDNKLPDLVADLNGQIHIVLDGRIDSVNGGIRNTFDVVPDAPVTKFTLNMKGGKKGLLVNSTNLCKSKHYATSEFTGQNGKEYNTTPEVAAKCPKGKKAGKGKRHH